LYVSSTCSRAEKCFRLRGAQQGMRQDTAASKTRGVPAENTHTHTHSHTHAPRTRKHSRTHARTHAHARMQTHLHLHKHTHLHFLARLRAGAAVVHPEQELGGVDVVLLSKFALQSTSARGLSRRAPKSTSRQQHSALLESQGKRSTNPDRETAAFQHRPS